MAGALLSKSSIKSVRHTRVFYDIMKVDFHSNGSQRQSAEQQKPGCRCILTVGALDEGFLLLKQRLTMSTRLRCLTATTPENECVLFVYTKVNRAGPTLV